EVLNPRAVSLLNRTQSVCENINFQASGAASAPRFSAAIVTTAGLTPPRSPIIAQAQYEGASVLCVGYEGVERETNWQIETLLAECRPFEPRSAQTLIGPAADPLWAALTDFSVVDSSLSFKAN